LPLGLTLIDTDRRLARRCSSRRSHEEIEIKMKQYLPCLALPLTDAVGDEPEEEVTPWTISRIRLLPRR